MRCVGGKSGHLEQSGDASCQKIMFDFFNLNPSISPTLNPPVFDSHLFSLLEKHTTQSAAFTHADKKTLKSHQQLLQTINRFIWSGVADSFTITDNRAAAKHRLILTFSLLRYGICSDSSFTGSLTILTLELRKRDPAVYSCYSVSDNRKWQNKSFMRLLGMWVERGASATAVTRGCVLAFVLKG